jgi:hypothetical protein
VIQQNGYDLQNQHPSISQKHIFWTLQFTKNLKIEQCVIISKNRKTFKQSSAAAMPRNKLNSHTQFPTYFYKICTKISEKDHISQIQAVLVGLHS